MGAIKFKWLTGVGLCVGLYFVSTNALAIDGGRMHVQITNATSVSCQLTDQQLYHGRLDSAPPQSIMARDSKTFDAEQTLLGPDLMLSYKCDAKYISFKLQQAFALVLGKMSRVTVLESQGLVLDTNTQSSSVFWGAPGIVNISIKSWE